MGVWDRLQQEKEQKENRENQVQEKHKSPVADSLESARNLMKKNGISF